MRLKKIFIIHYSLFIILLLLSGCKKQENYLEFNQVEEAKMTRSPAVAGAFYPADKETLESKISSFLLKAQKQIVDNEKIKILIVPHAGYVYSGLTVAWGFKQTEGESIKRVILLGSSHQSYFAHAAVYNKGWWETPLGKVEIDEDFANSLINQSEAIEANLDVHTNEHSLEVEVPFLQYVLSDFKLVPILLGHSSNDVLDSLTKTLAQNLDNTTLLVISTDLSHYPSYEIAKTVDEETINAILSLDVNRFSQKISENLDKTGVDTCACGSDAVKVGMIMAKQLNINDVKLLNYSNSGDTGGDRSRVVGYASIGFYGDKSQPETGQPMIEKTQNKTQIGKKLNTIQQKELLLIARNTLESYLKDKKMPNLTIKDKALLEHLGAFVTLRKSGSLRGCIGEFEPIKPLYQVVQTKAIDAAVNDPRFSPVKFNELKEISIEISVLSPRVKIDNWKEIKLGEHGVVIKKGLRGGTYLPQVATETGWSLEEFLSSLCQQKAGLAKDCYKDKNTDIFVFTAQVFSEEELN